MVLFVYILFIVFLFLIFLFLKKEFGRVPVGQPQGPGSIRLKGPACRTLTSPNPFSGFRPKVTIPRAGRLPCSRIGWRFSSAAFFLIEGLTWGNRGRWSDRLTASQLTPGGNNGSVRRFGRFPERNTHLRHQRSPKLKKFYISKKI